MWSGSMDIESAHKCSDTTNDSITIGEELKRIGYAGDVEVSHKTNPLSAHFEVVIVILCMMIYRSYTYLAGSFSISSRRSDLKSPVQKSGL